MSKLNILKFAKESKWQWLILILVSVLIIFCAFPSHFFFLNDDFIHIPMAKGGYIGHHNSLRHVNDLSLYLDYLWAGKNAWGYHFTNLLLHLANMLLAIPLLKKLSSTLLQRQVPVGFAIIPVALFGIYAFHSEAVFWILCRTASLSLFFNLLSWLCFFYALKNRLWLIPFIAFFLLGIFTYESLWVYPFWLVTWYFLLPKISEVRLNAKLPICIIWLLFIAYFPVRYLKTGALLGTYEASDVEHFNFISLIGKTARLLFRSFLPPMQNEKLLLVCAALIALLLLFAAILIFRGKKIDKYLIFLTIAWLVSYFPYVSLGISTTGYESERYLYYPSFFLCVLIIYVIYLLFANPLPRYFAIILLFLFHGFFFIRSSQDFRQIGLCAKEGIEAVKSVSPAKKIVIVDLPVYIRGVPVFNYGFKNGVNWLVPGRDSLDIKIISNKLYKNTPVSVLVTNGDPLSDTIIFSGN